MLPFLHGYFVMVVGTMFIVAVAVYVSVVAILYIARPLYSADFDYRGKHAVITGGSSGIGLDAAKEYLRRGCNVTIIARNQHRLDNAIECLRPFVTSAQKINAVSVDCSSSIDAVISALSHVVDDVGDVDVLVNCAGTSVAADFDETQPMDFERMLRINVLGSIYPTRAVIQGMKRNKRGRIVFVSSQVTITLHL
jgi:3-dehydrosphinganine reductase